MRRISAWSVVQMLSPILFCSTILILSSHCRSAVHNITSQISLADGQTLISAGNRFGLGFFGQTNSYNVKRYVGIWYISNPEIVVWVANRRKPLSDKTGLLSIVADGNLKLLDEKGNVYWSTELELKRFDLRNLVANLSDDGNLALLDGRSGDDFFWQSFNKPTDTFLFGMKMDTSLALTSWKTGKDPEPGNFTFKRDPVVGDQFLVMEKSITFWKSSRPDSGQVFGSAENEMPTKLVNFLNLIKNGTDNFNDQRLVMNFTGELQYWQWDAYTKSWSLIWWVPKDKCGSFNYCGNFGICNANNRLLPCKCMPGFKPKFSDKWNAGYFSDGCTRNSTSSCGNMFLNLINIKVENTDLSHQVTDEAQCRLDCLDNCQCQAYTYVVQRDNNNACLTWTEDLKDLQEDKDDGFELYVRVAVSDIESTTRNCETCGTNLVPYPLSTGSKCGDALYSSFHCNNSTDQLSFITSSGSYDVTRVNPEVRIFVIQIQSKEANNCDSLQSSGSRFLQLNQSSPFSVTSWCGSGLFNFTSNDSLLNDIIEVAISWKPPPEPTCNSSADCKDWPDSMCNTTGNGQRRCLCNTKFRWDGSALNCTRAVPSEYGQVGRAPNRNKSILLIIVLPIAIAMGLLCMVVSIYIWRRKVVKKRTKQRKAALQRYDTERGVQELIDSDKFKEKDGTGIDVPFFELESILAATDNFSDENKLGKGGFGPVYKGKFPGGEEIAVKRLSSVSGQGLEEFRNEVVLIAKLQHRNLVRLLGYCISGEEKILLYEYMPNRSLDSWIFDESFSHQLDWQTRFNIILGIARGMLYLHQDSRLRIIHRDLKTSNILLDAEMNPKISDFGLARMIQGKQTEANTLRVIGTYGYMAPEYALDGLFSVKSDAFSFGVLMLEIISGKKNMRFYSLEHAPSLIGYAWELWQEGKAMDLMDESIRSSCNASEFLRCVHVGLLCLQEDPGERPTMSNVVVLLGSETASLPLPKQPAFVTRKTVSSSASTSSKLGEISTTQQEGR